MKYTTLSIPFVKRHDPSIDTNIRLLIEEGYSTKEIASETKKSKRTIYNYAENLSLKFKKRGRHHDEEPPPEDSKQRDRSPRRKSGQIS